MDEKVLYKAAREGNISLLQSLLEENPMLLERPMPLFTETPLHVAASAGKTEFVMYLLGYAPRLAKEPSCRRGLNAMHMAVANGHADVVSVLLDFDPELSVTGDSEGSVSLHYAAYHGRVDIAKLLVSREPAILAHVNFKGENALHIAVKRRQNDVLKVLEDMLESLGNDFCNQVIAQAKDGNGNTVEQLKNASTFQVPAGVSETHTQNLGSQSGGEVANNADDDDDDDEENEKFSIDVMIVIGVLIATVTFQSLISPPKSLVGDQGIVTTNSPSDAIAFLCTNSIGFFASCFGIMAAAMGKVYMMGYWVAGSLIFTVLSYIFVLSSMMEGKTVIYSFFRDISALVLYLLIMSLYITSTRVRNFVDKIIDYVKS